MEEQEQEAEGGGGFNWELLHSYLAFARRALRQRWRMSAAAFAVSLALTAAVAVYWPRTYACATSLMAVGNGVLDGMDDRNPLAGAVDLIQRHENLEAMIRDMGLIQKIAERRPPLLRLKDKIYLLLFGPMSEKLQMQSFVGTLEQRVVVTNTPGVLTIKATWSDPRTAAELAEAARQSFVAARHVAEISAFEDKMTILDGHASKIREEIGTIAQQLRASRDEKLAQARDARAPTSPPAGASDAAASTTVRTFARKTSLEPDARLPALKEKLDPLKAKLATLEADRDRRLREEQAKFEDMKLRLTPLHPEVVTAGKRVAMLSQIPAEVLLLRAEVKDLESEIAARTSLARQSRDAGGISSAAAVRAPQAPAATEAPLPLEITELLNKDNLDPALSAQLDSALTKYTSLRADVLSTRIDLDTAQAAFNHRYQVIVPAEIPTKADKPKPILIVGGGLALTLVLSLLLPLAAALRAGVINERWQVAHLGVPVLAELRLPPYSLD